MVEFPTDLAEVLADERQARQLLRAHGLSGDLLRQIEIKALRTQRRQTGAFQTNREVRWARPFNDPIVGTDPQYGTELDCHIILVKLFAQIFCFDNAPTIDDPLRTRLERHYLGQLIEPGTYKDSLLLERFNFADMVAEGLNPIHGRSSFHLGHENPTISPKHQPGNIAWRTHRSNLIQGDMTLREARIYFVKLIGRYFELGEIDIT